ncbi:hypothetical protein FGB62_36g16 [Gracilaria domingensis]|nr:hypothetical protein FGB62_36g16 [Gracilaria domingensis]
MRASLVQGLQAEDGRMGASTTVVSHWIRDYLPRKAENREYNQDFDGGVLAELNYECSDDEALGGESSDEASMDECERWEYRSWTET